MARSRKMPPLFEVMRETDRKPEETRHAHAPVVLPRPSAPRPRGDDPGKGSGRLRLSEEDAVRHRGETASEEDSGVGAKGVMLPLPMVLGGAGVLVGVIAVIAILAFQAGAKREREALLPDDGEPPVVMPQRSGDTEGGEEPARPAPSNGAAPASARASNGGPALPVFGDDPREEGKNYLVVERLLFDDAMQAAQFLTDNGVPSVVVAPEGIKPADLQQQVRGLWLVIVREGFSRDEFRARSSRVTEIKNAVVRLGRRFKQDQRGPSDFASCLWDKFGK